MQAKNLTVRNVFIGQYPNEDEDFVYRYPSNKNCYIEYYKYKNGVCIQIYRVHAPSEEDKLNCLKAFCNEMYGGGYLLIDVLTEETHFDDATLYKAGFFPALRKTFQSYNPNIRTIIDDKAENELEKGKLHKKVDTLISCQKKHVDQLAQTYRDRLSFLIDLIFGTTRMGNTTQREVINHIHNVLEAITFTNLTYGISSDDMIGLKVSELLKHIKTMQSLQSLKKGIINILCNSNFQIPNNNGVDYVLPRFKNSSFDFWYNDHHYGILVVKIGNKEVLIGEKTDTNGNTVFSAIDTSKKGYRFETRCGITTIFNKDNEKKCFQSDKYEHLKDGNGDMVALTRESLNQAIIADMETSSILDLPIDIKSTLFSSSGLITNDLLLEALKDENYTIKFGINTECLNELLYGEEKLIIIATQLINAYSINKSGEILNEIEYILKEHPNVSTLIERFNSAFKNSLACSDKSLANCYANLLAICSIFGFSVQIGDIFEPYIVAFSEIPDINDDCVFKSIQLMLSKKEKVLFSLSNVSEEFYSIISSIVCKNSKISICYFASENILVIKRYAEYIDGCVGPHASNKEALYKQGYSDYDSVIFDATRLVLLRFPDDTEEILNICKNADDTIKGKISGIIPQGIDGMMPL